MEEGLASYTATQDQNTIQHYYAGSKPKRKEKTMACKKGKGKPGKK